MKLKIMDYGGGYRPTASGSIGGRDFVFRMIDGRWSFAVGRSGRSDLWWHSDPEDFEFEVSGESEPLFQDDAIPLLVSCLSKYLTQRGVAPEEMVQILRDAELQSRALLG